MRANNRPARHRLSRSGPDEGVVRWLNPDSAAELGSGALLNVKIDRLSVPHTTMMVATQKLAASGIPVHIHTWEDEVLYVIKGRGFAVINEEQTPVPIETGSVLYIPLGEWHGLKNVDPKDPMDVLLVTTPVKAQWARRLLPLRHGPARASAAQPARRESSSSWSGSTAWRCRNPSSWTPIIWARA